MCNWIKFKEASYFTTTISRKSPLLYCPINRSASFLFHFPVDKQTDTITSSCINNKRRGWDLPFPTSSLKSKPFVMMRPSYCNF